jgi:hypothetical protein
MSILSIFTKKEQLFLQQVGKNGEPIGKLQRATADYDKETNHFSVVTPDVKEGTTFEVKILQNNTYHLLSYLTVTRPSIRVRKASGMQVAAPGVINRTQKKASNITHAIFTVKEDLEDMQYRMHTATKTAKKLIKTNQKKLPDTLQTATAETKISIQLMRKITASITRNLQRNKELFDQKEKDALVLLIEHQSNNKTRKKLERLWTANKTAANNIIALEHKLRNDLKELQAYTTTIQTGEPNALAGNLAAHQEAQEHVNELVELTADMYKKIHTMLKIVHKVAPLQKK